MWPPHRIPFFLPWLYPTLTWNVQVDHPTLYLTFDDGPVYGPTEFVLETLSTFSAQATFFCIGDNVNKHPAVFNRLLAEGHRVGNHTFNHLNGWKFPTAVYVDNVERCQRELSTQLTPLLGKKLFRPPYGRITREQIRSLNDYSVVMWDVLSFDFLQSLAPEKCLMGTIRASRPGSIVVFHDSIKAEKNLRYALPRFLEHFRERGYSFKGLPV